MDKVTNVKRIGGGGNIHDSEDEAYQVNKVAHVISGTKTGDHRN
jgi:hypothetical protein